MSNRERTPVSVERANAETAAVATPEIPGGYPGLTASQLDLIRERSTEMVVDAGAFLANAGDVDCDFMLVEAGDLEVVRLAAFGLPEQVIAIFGPGSFLGELAMLTGQAAMFSVRMPVGGVISRMPRPVFRQLMSDAPELSDVQGIDEKQLERVRADLSEYGQVGVGWADPGKERAEPLTLRPR
jgi:CRP-like cAMP-binding protein